MNLDFTMLSGLPAHQPVRKPWGQAGTTGTPLLTRACVVPLSVVCMFPPGISNQTAGSSFSL